MEVLCACLVCWPSRVRDGRASGAAASLSGTAAKIAGAGSTLIRSSFLMEYESVQDESAIGIDESEVDRLDSASDPAEAGQRRHHLLGASILISGAWRRMQG